MGTTGGTGEGLEGRLGEAEGGVGGVGGGSAQPSPGKNISNQEMQAQFSALQVQVHSLAAQNASITVHSLTAQLALLSTENASLNSANESLKSKNESLKCANDSLKAANDSLKAANDSLKAANDSLKSANDSLKSANASLKPANESLKSANDSLTAEITRLAKQSNSHTCPPVATTTIPDLASIDMNTVMKLSPSQLSTLDAGLRRVRARILATTDAHALRRLVEKEVPSLLVSVGVSMDLYVGSDGGWNLFCERRNSSECRWESLYSHRRKNIENFANWTSYAMVICLDVVHKLCLWRNIS